MTLVRGTLGGAGFCLALLLVSASARAEKVSAPVVDPTGMLASGTRASVTHAAQEFYRASGKWMVVMVAPSISDLNSASLRTITKAPWQPADRADEIGIFYITSPQSRGGELLVVDPDWRKVAGHMWIPLFPQRLAEKFGDLPFEERVRESAAYLAEQFPQKIEFLMPETRRIDPASLAVARFLRKAFEWFFIFVMFYTVLRTLWPNELKDTDTDERSQEIRKLRDEPFRW